MKKIILPILMLLIFNACNEESGIDPAPIILPACIQAMADETGDYPFLTIQMQTVDEEPHYWLNTGAMEADGFEYIVNEQCDSICYYCGFCGFIDCRDRYNQEDWVIIWE